MISLFEQYFEKRGEFLDLELSLSRINEAAKDFIIADTKVIHVAGTNGKGSTSFFISQFLRDGGFTTLLFTSPHIQSVRERIRLNMQAVSGDAFDALFTRALPYVEKYTLSYFETIFLMVLILNSEKKCDYMVLETGLGGRFDATNTDAIVLKTSVITSISQDHKHILGRKIEEIVKEKAAVVRSNTPVFVGHNPDFIVDILRGELPASKLILVGLDELDAVREHYPDPFSYNYLNARNVAEYLLGKRLGIKKLELPKCRQERIGRVILDGAHNPSALISLLKSFDEESMPKAVLLSSTFDRDINSFINILKGKIPVIILTTIPANDRGIALEQLRMLPYKSFEEPLEALKYLSDTVNGGILVTGSLYLCAYVRSRLVNNEE